MLLSLINQTLFITPLRSSVCLHLCFFVSLLFIPAVSGKFVLKTGCVFMWPCLESQVHIKMLMYASTLREQRRFPVEVITISFTVVPIPEDSGRDSSDVVTVFYSCADS